jgi:DNA-binding MarR family transcriptional regulator
MGHAKYRTDWHARFLDSVNGRSGPKRDRRNGSKDKRNRDRAKQLEIGFVQARRADRWAVRKHGDWLLYTVYEHLFDLARFRGWRRGQALVFLWEIAADLNVNVATVSRKIRKLEELGFIRSSRSKSDCFPNAIHILHYEPKDSTDDTSHGGQNQLTPCSTRSKDALTPCARQRSDRI